MVVCVLRLLLATDQTERYRQDAQIDNDDDTKAKATGAAVGFTTAADTLHSTRYCRSVTVSPASVGLSLRKAVEAVGWRTKE